ncbi:MAG TPA: ATP phosphoribosyltransferase [Caulobacteraceae bacterium]
MSGRVILAVPSKGRLKEQTETWLADSGARLDMSNGARGYQAALAGFDGVEVRLASAADIAASLSVAEIHLGVTGEDLLGETAAGALPLLALGFGRADLVVAAPRSWIDVETMADVDDVAHDILARTGRRLRVATKYAQQTRAFFAAHGVADYRIVESGGATEGAPAAGAAELVVDITTTGATLAANGLKPLVDGLILKSQAHLAAAPGASWDGPALAVARRLLSVFEATARGKTMARLAWPADQDSGARQALGDIAADGLAVGAALIARAEVFLAAESLAAAGIGPIAVEEPAYVFQRVCEAADRLTESVRKRTKSRTSP